MGGEAAIAKPSYVPEGVALTEGLTVGKVLPTKGTVDATKMLRQSAEMYFTFKTKGSATVAVTCWAEGSI